MRKKQLEFQQLPRPKDEFGGQWLKGNPKGKRPLASKLPIHLTLRARKSVLRTPRNFALVEEIIEGTAKKHGVRLFKRANVGNHLHLAIKLANIKRWASFIRELTGRLGLLCKVPGGLWLYRPHTRIIRGWRKAFAIVKDYIRLNQLEAEGRIDRLELKTLADYRRTWVSTS